MGNGLVIPENFPGMGNTGQGLGYVAPSTDNTGCLRLFDNTNSANGEGAGSGEVDTITGNVGGFGGNGYVRVDGSGAIGLSATLAAGGIGNLGIAGTTADILNLAGIVSGNVNFDKVGPGELEFSGPAPNTITASSAVFQGAELLNKAAGVNNLGATSITIGDNVGAVVGGVFNAQNADVIQLENANELISTANTGVTVQSTGLLDLNGFMQTFADDRRHGRSRSTLAPPPAASSTSARPTPPSASCSEPPTNSTSTTPPPKPT